MFDRLPTITYNNQLMADITKRLRICPGVKTNAATYDWYTVKDGEKIEDVAHRYYGSPTYHVVIILMNDIVDPFYDWPMSQTELNKYVTMKYPDGPDAVHHWELDGQTVDPNTPGAVALSNYQYEERLNEQKRQIKLLRKEHLAQFEKEMRDLLVNK